MFPRQKELFKHIVEEYVKTAQPVGSKLVVEKFNLDISPATVRNDMAELEEQDLIFSPHISAGRIPTEYGFKYYVENYINFKGVKDFKDIKKNKNIKEIAKQIAEESGLAVLVGFGAQDVFYTGLSNLFSQPEFQNLNLVFDVTRVLDHLDEVMEKVYNEISQLEIKIGSDNPFSQDCSAVLIKNKSILFGILGPMRMNYQKNVQLVNLINEII
jgi:transcriptional regulator of heat shock response